ncbi:hypothetical protein G7Y89_g4209 [Cudoniella acicularis]|uniref:Glycoside hydrolase family 5 domain-containing protein n=1 Tax=Cudoniella acicularis TaxID=354080 RepID=A0A8H4RRB3_9HELO|nr:hypothetical protein G7Y89_g4209 [Cudoniella acicularis]
MQYTTAILCAAFAVTSVFSHGVVTEVKGANGCGAQDDTAIIRDNELGISKASALGRTKADGPVTATQIIAVFMDGAGNKTACDIHEANSLYRRQLFGGGAKAAGSVKAPAGTSETSVAACVGAGASSSLPTTSDFGEIHMTLHQINQDGARPFTAMVDGTSGGTDPAAFKNAQVTQNIPGIVAGVSATTTTNFQVKIQMPTGITCGGTVGAATNIGGFDENQEPQTDDSPTQPQNQSYEIGPPTPNDIFRYRYHLGTNLGSVFVLEKWLSPSMFLPSKGDSELDAVTASVNEKGVEETRKVWEQHWRSAVSDEDFGWLVGTARCTSIRLPVGWWMMGGEFIGGSVWEKVGVFMAELGARSFGIGVLIDLHGLPGGANSEAHSGTCSGKTELWGKKNHLTLAKKVLHFIAQEVRNGMDGVTGIQVVNEACYDAKGMYDFYEQVIDIIGEVDESIPIYVSDGWDLGRALDWSTGRSPFKGGKKNPIVIDTHKYYTFSEKDRNQSPQEIIGRIGSELCELDGKDGSLSDRGEAEIIIGEWSCVLDGRTWGRVQPQEKDGLVRQFGQIQSQKWSQRTGGSFFWTYKMDWMDGGEWGFAEQIKKGNIFIPPFLLFSADDVGNRLQAAQDRREELFTTAQGSHEDYWNRTCPGKHFEHGLFGEGWKLGFSDATVFFGMRVNKRLGDRGAGDGGDKIGCLEIWVKKRILESGQRGEFKWEWEQGFRAGVKAFEGVVGIQ